MSTNIVLRSPHSPANPSSSEWSTPAAIFEALNAEFDFNLDVAADPSNAKCSRYFTESENGLSRDWSGQRVWCNPPYGRGQIQKWAKKSLESSRAAATVVMLLPSDTGTRWFHDYCLQGEIRFLKGRLRFGGTRGTPTFASIVVIFRPKANRFGRICSECQLPIGSHHRYHFVGSSVRHRDCDDPTLSGEAARLQSERRAQTELLPNEAQP